MKLLSHPERYRRAGELAGDIYDTVMRHASKVSVAEAVGALELVKVEVVATARDEE